MDCRIPNAGSGRLGRLIAADLGIAPEAVMEALTGHVQQQLVDLGEPTNAFGNNRTH